MDDVAQSTGPQKVSKENRRRTGAMLKTGARRQICRLETRDGLFRQGPKTGIRQTRGQSKACARRDDDNGGESSGGHDHL